jgi:hypothetical protein
MRVSTDPTDRGHDQWLTARSFGMWARVTLDGVEQKMVLTSDDKAGLVVRCADPLRVDADGNVVSETLHGAVAIEFFPEA